MNYTASIVYGRVHSARQNFQRNGTDSTMVVVPNFAESIRLSLGADWRTQENKLEKNEDSTRQTNPTGQSSRRMSLQIPTMFL